MRVLELHTGFNIMGGAESMIIGLSNEMAKSHDVTVCSVFKPTPNSLYYTRFSNKVNKIHLGVEKSGFSIKNILKVYNYLKDADYDIVHFHGLFYYFALPIILTHRRLKYVYTFHSDAYKEQGKWDKRIQWLKRFCLKHNWMLPVTISPQSKESFWSYYHLDSELIENGIPKPIISNNVDVVGKYRITPHTKIFFHPGRICVPKNQVVLCKVFKRLIDNGYDVVLLIAGTKQEENIYEEMKPYFSDRIVYLGERNDVSLILSQSDGFCLPSIWEGLPVTLLESLSVGCIPICSPVGGIPSVVNDGDNGLLSKTSSEKDYYARMVERLSMKEEKVFEMKRACVDSFAPYDIVNTADKYIQYFLKVKRM